MLTATSTDFGKLKSSKSKSPAKTSWQAICHKVEIYYKYSHYVPDDPDDQRAHFFSKCEIPINRGSRTKQVLNITIEKHTIHFFVRYGIKRNKDLCLPINYKTHDKNKTSAPVSATGADGYLLVETTGLEPVTPRM